MSTLLYHFGALGDFITTLPAIAWWRRQHPGPITLLGKTAIGNLAQRAGYIDHVIDADSHRFLFIFNKRTAAEPLKAFFGYFDALLIFANDDSGITVNARRHFSGKLVCQPPLPAGALHAVDYHLSLFPRSELEPVHQIPIVAIASSPRRPALLPTDNRPMIAIHPGSGSEMKNWPIENFLSIAGSLKQLGYAPVWMTGPAEPTLPLPENDPQLCNPTLDDCALFLSRCTGYLGNDSGITHLAAAVGCRVVALFGPSDPARWAPRGIGTVTVIHHPPPECAPCHLRPYKNLKCNRECMQQITVDEVLATFAD